MGGVTFFQTALGCRQDRLFEPPGKYAVASGWFPPENDPENIVQRYCPIVLELRNAALAASEAWKRNRAPPPLAFDMVMLTNGSALPAEARAFLEVRGIKVMDVEEDPLIKIAAKHGSTMKNSPM